MKVKSNSFKFVDMWKVIKKTINMVRKMLRKRITRMKKIKLIKISQERNLF